MRPVVLLEKPQERAPQEPERVHRARLRDRVRPYLMVAPAMTLIGVLLIAVTGYNVVLSVQEVSLFELGDGVFVGFANFGALLSSSAFWAAAGHTAFWLTATTVLVRLPLGLGLALLVDAKVMRRFRLTGAARSLMLLPWTIPPVVAVASWKWMFDPTFGVLNQALLGLGLIDEPIVFLADPNWVWPSVIAIVVWREVPFVALMYLTALQAIPRELYEAARIDGASSRQVFRHITLPLLKPMTLVVALLTTIWTFNNFQYVWLTTGGGPGAETEVLGTLLYSRGFVDYDMGTSAATGVLMALTMLVLSSVYFRTRLRREGT